MTGAKPAGQPTDTVPDFDAAVLLVDDNAVSNAVVRSLLLDMGCRVEVAGNGLEALTQLERARFDLVLMDCEMPVMDGMAATRRLRQRELREGTLNPVPVIAFTTHDRAEVESECLDAGMDAWLQKPCSRQDLTAVMHRWIGSGSDRASSAATITDEQVIISDDLLNAYSPPERRSFDLVREMLLEERMGELQALLELFTTQTDTDLVAMRQAMQGYDLQELRRRAHVVRTSSASLGANRLSDLCRKLHATATRGDHGHCRPLLSAIDDEYQLVKQALRAEYEASQCA